MDDNSSITESHSRKRKKASDTGSDPLLDQENIQPGESRPIKRLRKDIFEGRTMGGSYPDIVSKIESVEEEIRRSSRAHIGALNEIKSVIEGVSAD